MESVLEKIASPSQTVLYAVGITALAFLYNFISYFRIWIAAVDLPYVGFEKFSIPAFLKARNRANSNDIWEMVQEGYKKYKGEPFRIPTLARNTVYIPPKYFNEIKSLPDDVVSFSAANNDNLEGDYTGIKTDSEELHVFIKLVRAELTQSIAHLMGEIQEEATFSVEEELGDVKSEWTQVPVYAKMLRVVSRTSGRIFVGPNICRDEGWMSECIMYTVNVFSAASALKEISWIRKKLFYWTLPELKTVYRTKKHAIDILKPEIIRRRKAEEEAKARGEEWKDRPDDFLEWYRQATIDHPRFSKIDYQAWLQLQLSMAAIHTTSITTTHIIYDIAAHPEFVDELREEAMKVVAQYGGKLTKMGMGKLSKLDSFMKESQRVNTLSVSSISRQVVARKGITLSNGLHLPYGTRIHTPQNEIYQDPAVFKDADKFDPWRFHRLRQTPNNEVAGQFVTTSSEFASFGHGKHACPGRFFAAAEVKGFITILLSRFEWRLPEGQMERPQNFRRVAGQMPNPMAMIEFRRRPAHEIFL